MQIPEIDPNLELWLETPETFVRRSLMGREIPEKNLSYPMTLFTFAKQVHTQ